MRRALLSSLLIPLLLSGCMVGPDYKRPSADVPAAFRASSPEQAKAEAASLGDQKWWEVFGDERLQSLIRTAIQQNYDVRIAATRVLQAQAQLGVTRSNQFPSVSGGADLSAERTSKSITFPAIEQSTGQVSLSAAWQLDFWGQYRRATESARASLLATEWGRRAVITSIVAGVASAYFQLRALDLQLELSQSALTARRESLRRTSVLSRPNNSSTPTVKKSPTLNAAFSSRKISSAFFSETILDPSLVACGSPSSRTLRKFLPACLPIFSSAAQTFANLNSCWSPPTLKSVLPAPPTIPKSLSPLLAASRAMRSPAFSPAPRVLDLRRFSHPTHFHRRQNPFPSQSRRGPAAGSSAFLSANNPAVFSRCFRCSHRLSKKY